MDRKKVIIPVVVIAVAGVAFWRWLRPGEDPNLIRVSGNIELTQIDLSFKTPGRIVQLAVDEGDAVQKDQLIAKLDETELQHNINGEQAAIASARSMLVQLGTTIKYQDETTLSDIALKRADLAQSEARLRELQNGSRPQEIAQAQANVANAETQYVQAKADYERAERLIKNDDISRQQFDQFKAKYESTAALLKQARESFALVKEGPRQEEIDQAKATVERARAALRVSEANRIDLTRRRQEIPMREADIQRAESQMGVLSTQLGDRTVVAPVNGVVLTKSAEMGEVMAAGATVVTLGDMDHPWVRGYINEKDLGRIKLGMKADVVTDSYPGKVYPGKITFISSDAEFTPKQIQTQEERTKLVYRIKIEMANPHRELKSNMPVDATIRVQ